MQQHGEERNRRVETRVAELSTFSFGGQPMLIPTMWQTATVSERWCDVCKAWVTCDSIVKHILCTKCGTEWATV